MCGLFEVEVVMFDLEPDALGMLYGPLGSWWWGLLVLFGVMGGVL